MNVFPKIITIKWDGPFALAKLEEFNRAEDYGLYQIYGTHNIFGRNALLYLGKAEDQSFAKRIPDHKKWIVWEPAPVDIYLGRLCGTEPTATKSDKEWCDDISVAESLLIFFSTPPYNSVNIQSYGNIKDNISDVIVLNYEKRNRLPMEVSTYYEDVVMHSRLRVYGEGS